MPAALQMFRAWSWHRWGEAAGGATVETLKTVLALALAYMPTLAKARLCFCSFLGAGVRYKHDGRWISRGWWFAKTGDCVTPVEGALQQRYYYVHFQSQAKSVSFDNPNTDYGFCAMQEPFVTHGADNCIARSYEWREFDQVDTGESLDYTLTIR